MSLKHFHVLASTLVIMFATSAATPAIAQYAGAIVDSVTPVGYGRYRITGTALDSRGNAACALALASGRCMFTCGPGSLRCEGGTANLPFGRFDLTDLPPDPTTGTIDLQVFVAGNISLYRPINPGGGIVQWRARNTVCCTTGPLTFSFTMDGTTRSSTLNSCNSSPTLEGFAITTPGTKAWSMRIYSQACGINEGGPGLEPATLVLNTCYEFELHYNEASKQFLVGQKVVSCSWSANENTLEEKRQVTPMAIYPISVDPSGSGQVRWDLLKDIGQP